MYKYLKDAFFDEPTQVNFIDGTQNYYKGIGYKDEIICLCCGGVFKTRNVLSCPLSEWWDITYTLNT